MKLGSFSQRSRQRHTGCPSQMSQSEPCCGHEKPSHEATSAVVARPPSGNRAATQLCSPHTLVQHFSVAKQSWGVGAAQQVSKCPPAPPRALALPDRVCPYCVSSSLSFPSGKLRFVQMCCASSAVSYSCLADQSWVPSQ